MGAREFANPRLGARTRKAIVDFMLNPSPNFKGPKQDVEKKQDDYEELKKEIGSSCLKKLNGT